MVSTKYSAQIRQVRRQNRKLFKGARSHIRNTASRYIMGFQRFDKVDFNGKKCFIFGRRSTGYMDLKTLSGEKVHSSANHKKLKLLQSFRTLLTERRNLHSSPPNCKTV